ncbi:hypothetical protein CCASP_03100 [Corynebacterium caspium DSM 44850]|nr:hypothetical protein CCASP_03100 [Corynebacterium caspium DSM 44850]
MLVTTYAAPPTSISLSTELRVAFKTTVSAQYLTHLDLSQADITLQQAWNFAAQETLKQASTVAGVEFFIRKAQCLPDFPKRCPGLEIGLRKGDITNWLTHPQIFQILNEHLQSKLDAPVAYLLPEAGKLVAIPANRSLKAAATWLAKQDAPVSKNILQYSCGFPTPLNLAQSIRRSG